jgi:hypothetical protein
VRLAGEAQPGEVLCGPAAAAAGSGAAALQPVPRGGAFRLR